MKPGSLMSRDQPLLRTALPSLGVALTVLAAIPYVAHAQASRVSALAAASLVPGTGAAVPAGVPAGGMAVRVGETEAPAGLTTEAGVTAEGGVTSLTTAEVADMVRRQQGRPTVVILYGTNCPRSEAMFPGFTALAERHAAGNVAFLAFAADQPARQVPPFLAQFGAPFQPLHIKPRPPGQIGRDMATIGLQLGSTWNMPHVAVLDASGQVVGEWDAATDLRAIDAAVSSVR